MGQELTCQMQWDGKALEGKAFLETDYILFRGEERLKILLKDLKGVTADAGVLNLEFPGGPAKLVLGAAAEKWALKILHPPSRLDKLGVKNGTTALLAGDFDAAFAAELCDRNVRAEKGKQDLVFYAAQKTADLRKVAKLAGDLKPAGALWVVYPKGQTAIREIEVIEAGRAAGLKDVKVCAFSSTHTALKFVIPAARRS